MGKRKRFTDDEIYRIVECSFEGLSYVRIAKSFSTSYSHIKAIVHSERGRYITRSLWRAEKMNSALD